jgi:nitroreductase
MDTYETILTRRTIKNFKAVAVPADVLARALTAGLWAQNHRMTEPWRFTVLGPQTHRALANGDAKLMSKPCIVAVSYRLSQDDQQQREDYAATCCAVQNIQLAAWADGLGMQWSTGRVSQLPSTYQLLGINPAEEEMAGLLFFGYPEVVPEPAARKPLVQVMRQLP